MLNRIATRHRNQAGRIGRRAAAIFLVAVLSLGSRSYAVSQAQQQGEQPAPPLGSLQGLIIDLCSSAADLAEQLSRPRVAAWGYNLDDCFKDVVVAGDGTVYAVGESGGMGVVVHFDQDLSELGSVTFSRAQSSFNAVDVAPDGSVYAGGSRLGSNGVSVAVVVKYSPELREQGKAEWYELHDSYCQDVLLSDDGTVYAVGLLSNWGYIVQYDSNLRELANARYYGGFTSSFDAVTVGSDGAVYAVGMSQSNRGKPFALVVRYDQDLNEQELVMWQGGIGVDDQVTALLHDIIIAPDGSLYAVGVLYDDEVKGVYTHVDETTSHGFILGFGPGLTFQDDMTWVDSGSSFNALLLAPDGTLHVVGHTASAAGGGAGETDALLLKLDRSFNELDAFTWGGDGRDVLYSVTQAADGPCYAVGVSASTDSANTGFESHGLTDAVIVK